MQCRLLRVDLEVDSRLGMYCDHSGRAAVAAVRELNNAPTDYLKLRERCYGTNWSDTEESIISGQGALDGSIDKWIEILQLVSSSSSEGTRFLQMLRAFLACDQTSLPDKGVDLGPLVRSWARTCDVPPSVKPELVPVKDAIQAVNTFRNRFAHVPFPYDQLQDVARDLETCTFRLFEVQSATSPDSSLSGCFSHKDHLLRGAGFHKTPDAWKGADHECFVWGKLGEQDSWDARPFILLDRMMRPYLLTRLKNEAGWWEYTRYLAEANAVTSITNPDLLKLLPRPTEEEYRPKKSEQLVQLPEPEANGAIVISVPATQEEAFAAIREGKFEAAIEYFTRAVKERPAYHSGWQRLGVAQREWAVRLMDEEPSKAIELMRQSLNSFRHAIGHIDPQYAAEAFYNRSKSHWRLWQVTSNSSELKYSLRDAEEAARKHYEERFLSWVEFLRANAASAPVGSEADPPPPAPNAATA
jgi:tetratricopeptide (TPR) repeat protein